MVWSPSYLHPTLAAHIPAHVRGVVETSAADDEYTVDARTPLGRQVADRLEAAGRRVQRVVPEARNAPAMLRWRWDLLAAADALVLLELDANAPGWVPELASMAKRQHRRLRRVKTYLPPEA